MNYMSDFKGFVYGTKQQIENIENKNIDKIYVSTDEETMLTTNDFTEDNIIVFDENGNAKNSNVAVDDLFSGDYNDLTNKPTIPSAYSLPTASATTKGGVKIGDGLEMNGDVLSAIGGGGGNGVVYQIQSTTNNPDPNVPTFPAVFDFGTSYANHKILVFTNTDFKGIQTLDASGCYSISNNSIVTYYALAL